MAGEVENAEKAEKPHKADECDKPGGSAHPSESATLSWDALIAGSGLPRLQARVLAEHAAKQPRAWMMAHGDEQASAEAAIRFAELARRARAGEPIAYLVGAREFHGRVFEVSPAVLIPREDTERIVDLALAELPRGARVLELGTGSGCIAITLACERPDLVITASDCSSQALEIALHNATRLLPDTDQKPLNQRLRLIQGDWYQALKLSGACEAPASPNARQAGDSDAYASIGEARFDAIVSNPPYIAAGDPHLAQGDLRFEPGAALTDGADGLSALRVIIAGAPSHLAPGGQLMLEHGWDQAAAVQTLLRQTGFESVRTLQDFSGRNRVSCGRWRAA
jgi:release factor glutamine methyltransferase